MPTKKNQQPKIKATDDPDRDSTGKFVKGNQRAAKPGEVRNPKGTQKRLGTLLSDAYAEVLAEMCEKDKKTIAAAIGEQVVYGLLELLKNRGLTKEAISTASMLADRTEGKPAQKVLIGKPLPTDPDEIDKAIIELLDQCAIGEST